MGRAKLKHGSLIASRCDEPGESGFGLSHSVNYAITLGSIGQIMMVYSSGFLGSRVFKQIV